MDLGKFFEVNNYTLISLKWKRMAKRMQGNVAKRVKNLNSINCEVSQLITLKNKLDTLDMTKYNFLSNLSYYYIV